jgi:hypothetical protein
LRRSPAFVCDCFLNSWKRILNEQEKSDLFFRQSTLSGILGQSAAMFHQMLAGLFQGSQRDLSSFALTLSGTRQNHI